MAQNIDLPVIRLLLGPQVPRKLNPKVWLLGEGVSCELRWVEVPSAKPPKSLSSHIFDFFHPIVTDMPSAWLQGDA